MALYSYQAFTKDGKKATGTVDATSLANARDLIVRMGFFPIQVVPTQEAKKTFTWTFFWGGKVSVKDKIFFTKQLSILLRSGVPLIDSLDLLAEQSTGMLRTIIIAVRDDIKEGKSLADGLAKYPKTFDNIYIQLVRAGEASGRLEVILDRLTSYMQRQQELRKKIIGALRYPAMQLFMIGGISIFLMARVVPEVAHVFEGQKMELPLNTRILLAISNFMTEHYLILLAGFVGLIVAYKAWAATKKGAHTIDAIKLKLPFIKYFARMNAVVQFSNTLGMLTEAGVNLAESLNIVTKIVDNRVLVGALNEAKENIIKQGRVAEYLKKTDIFPPMAIYLINTGEQSGQLDKMLLTVADNYERELKDLADGLSAMIEPVLLAVMAVVVGFIIFSIMTPIMEMQQAAGQF